MAVESDGSLQVPVQLKPFIHQVGGRATILQLDEYTICKPLIPQELDIYTSLPDILRPFVPKFKGVIEVSVSKDADGYLKLTAYPPDNSNNESCQRLSEYCCNATSGCRIRLNPTSGVVEIQGADENTKFEEPEGTSGVSHNPWLLYCHQKQLQALAPGEGVTQKFVVLENLTAAYRCPCVLDLKMGIRQYGDNATVVKIRRKQARVASTTSCTLGLRMCGMQVYRVDTNKFVCYNKYYGRTLSQEGFRQVLYRFLHNGLRLRIDVISELLESLQSLSSVVHKLHTFRFFCSSLLIIYDGLPPSHTNGMQPTQPSSCIRLIDFAHSTHSGLGNSLHEGPDDGMLFGLTNLTSLLTSLLEEGSSSQ